MTASGRLIIDVKNLEVVKEHIAQLAAERDDLQDKFETLELDYRDVCQKRLEAADSFSKQIIDLTNERDEWRAAAERLAKTFVIEVYPHEWACRGCHHMGKTPDTIEHAPNCPITLHRELVAKYGDTK